MTDLTSDEWNLLEMVRRIVDKTDFTVLLDEKNDIDRAIIVRQLGTAVVRIWAETYRGHHHVFPLVKVIGVALEIYADLQEGVQIAG